MRRTRGFHSMLQILILLLIIGVAAPRAINASSAPWERIEFTCHDVEEETLDCLIENQCELFDGDVNLLKARLNAFNLLELNCQIKPQLIQKVPLLKQLITQAWWFLDHPENGFEPNLLGLCGGIIDDHITSVKMEPETLELEIGEEKTITATFTTHYCGSGPKPYCGCEDDSDCDGGQCVEKAVEADLEWGSSNEDIVELKSVSSDGKQATVIGKGNGRAYITAKATDIEEIANEYFQDPTGVTHVEIGKTSADIVLVVETLLQQHWCYFPETGCDWPYNFADSAPLYWEKASDLFDEFRFGLVSYSIQPERAYDPNYCGADLAPEPYASRVDYPLTQIESSFEAAFQSLRGICGATPYVVNQGTDVGSSMYSGLLTAIQQFEPGQSEEKRAVILIGGLPACVDSVIHHCFVEPVSGISRDSIVAAANERNVSIYMINTWYGAIFPCIGDPGWFDDALVNESEYLTSQTGGQVYGALRCFPEEWEGVLNALEDIKAGNSGAPALP